MHQRQANGLVLIGTASAFVGFSAMALGQSPAMVYFDDQPQRGVQIKRSNELPAGTVLYDTLWITDEGAANAGVGNAIGGERAFPSLGTIDSQFADDFVVEEPTQITQVYVDCQSFFNGDEPDEGFWVQFYASNGSIPAEAVHAEVTLTDFTSEFKGMFAGRETYRYTLDLTDANIVLDAGNWWMDVQPLDVADGGWFWSLSVLDLTPPEGDYAHVRDGWLAHGNNYYGLWNSTTWLEHNFRGRATPARRIDGTLVGDRLQLSLNGSCPGGMRLQVAGATAQGTVGILLGLREGSYTIPSGPCQGTTLGLAGQGLRLLATPRADGNGEVTLSRNVPGGACGQFLQAVDGATCDVSNVVEIE